MIPSPILVGRTPAAGLILAVTAERGGLSGYVLLGQVGPPVSAELSSDGGLTWAALTFPHTLTPGEQLRLTRSDTSALLTTLHALAPVDEGAPPDGGADEPYMTSTDPEGYETVTNAEATTDADGYQTITGATATADADGYETVQRSTP